MSDEKTEGRLSTLRNEFILEQTRLTREVSQAIVDIARMERAASVESRLNSQENRAQSKDGLESAKENLRTAKQLLEALQPPQPPQ